MKNQTLIDEIRLCLDSKKYLGVNRMRKILNVLLDKLELPLTLVKEIPTTKQFEYEKYQYNEWLYVDDYKLYKSSAGQFTLEQYQYDLDDRKTSTQYFFNTELNLYYVDN